MLSPTAWMLTVAAWMGLAASASGQDGPGVLDPKTYRSPSGEYELFVDPSRPSGAGAASYRFSGNAVELWAGTRPWTLWGARVTDEGLVAGHAYARGRDGGPEDGLTILLLDRSG